MSSSSGTTVIGCCIFIVIVLVTLGLIAFFTYVRV